MGFVTVRDEGFAHYNRYLTPARGRPLELLELLEESVTAGTFVTETGALLEKMNRVYDADWEQSDLSRYLNPGYETRDLWSAGALTSIGTLGAGNQRALLLHGGIIRTLAPPFYEKACAELHNNIRRYQGAAALADEPTDPRAAWLYARLREWTDRRDNEDAPAVDIRIRQFGPPDDDPSWLDDFAYDEPPLLLGSFSKQFGELAILIDIEYQNLHVTDNTGLQDALGAELIGYYSATIHNSMSEFRKATSEPVQEAFLKAAAETSNPEDPAHISERVPFLDWTVEPLQSEGQIRISALFQYDKSNVS